MTSEASRRTQIMCLICQCGIGSDRPIDVRRWLLEHHHEIEDEPEDV